ncbi:MAG: hypothetical protein WAU75_12215 [Solirubrobacteraceae bacterium]
MRQFLLTLATTLSFVAGPLADRAAGAPRSVSLSGGVAGFKAPALGALEVQAVNANDGTVAGVATASRGGYRLTVAPGPYLVHVQDEDLRNGTTEGFSDVTSVGSAGGRLSIAPGGPPAARAATAGASPIIAIEPMQITAASGSGLKSGSMQGQVINAIFDPCIDTARYRLVDADPSVLDALKKEQQLKDQGRTTVDFAYNPVTPTYAITGSGTVDTSGQVIIDLSLVDLATGKTLDHVKGRGEASTIDSLIRRFGSGLAQRNCHENKPPGPVRVKPIKHRRKTRRPPQPNGSDGVYTATYAGNLMTHFVSSDGALSSALQLTFNAEITIDVRHGVVTSARRTLIAHGTSQSTGPPYAGGNANCTLSALGPTEARVINLVPIHSRPENPVDTLLVGAGIPAYIGKGFLSISGGQGCTGSGTVLPQDPEADWGAAVAPGPSFKIASLPRSKSYPVKDSYATGDGHETVRMSATLTVH